jgi:hypothetical protein
MALVPALAALTLAGCGGTDSSSDAPTPATATTKPAPKATVDPYDVYLKLAPKDAPELSREDAQARAYLGCGQKWAPGTVDAALAEAYADLCKRGG